jgi:hypothetical protein
LGSDVTARPVRVPPLMLMSPVEKTLGICEKEKVSVAVWPAINASLLLEIARVGAAEPVLLKTETF